MNPLPLRIPALGLVAALADFKVRAGSEEETRVHLGLLARWAGTGLRVRMCIS